MTNDMDLMDVPALMRRLREENYRVVTSISPEAVGHVLGETDNFLRMRMTGEVAADSRSVIFCDDHDGRLEVMKALFGNTLFDAWNIGPHARFIGSIIAHMDPAITVDAGYSSCKTLPPASGPGDAPFQWWQWKTAYANSNGVWTLSSTSAWYKRRSMTLDQFPYRDLVEPSERIEDLIGARGGKVTVLQTKTKTSSGVGVLPVPELYLPALAFLKDCGHTLVLGGREEMPECWRSFGVIDYANSGLASFENDFRLIKRASFGVMQASGMAMFFEVLDKPFVYLNTRMPVVPPFSHKAVYTPAIFHDVAADRPLTFAEQLAVDQPWARIDDVSMRALPATPQQILGAVQEAVARSETPGLPLTDRQKRHRAMGPEGSFTYSGATISDVFLADWEHLLDPLPA